MPIVRKIPTPVDQADDAPDLVSIRRALIGRAHAAGLQTLPWGDEGLRLQWPGEDTTGLAPLEWDRVEAWLDEYAADGPPTSYERAAPAVLSDTLQAIARRYVAARQRSGEAMLEAAAALSEARSQAKHGEWSTFLEATGTSEDTADRLLAIHAKARSDPAFADAIQRNWLTQSTAALLARISTPPDVVAAVLSAPTPPTARGIDRAIKSRNVAGNAEPPASERLPAPPSGWAWETDPQHPRAYRLHHTASDRRTNWHDLAHDTIDEAAEITPEPLASDANLIPQQQPEDNASLSDDLTSDNWYTPPWLIDAARAVLGGIDLDPASCDEAQAAICATTYYTEATNGLAHPWSGRIWLNPPYSVPLPWVQRLIDGVAAGTIDAGILLVNTANSPEWARLLWNGDYPICLLRKRVGFWRPSGATKGGSCDQMVAFVCRPDDLPRLRAFRRVFGEYGAIR